MTDIILHHYEISPYSEKVRLGHGLKGLAWGSVEIPVIMPTRTVAASPAPPLSPAWGRRCFGPVNKPGAVPDLEAVELLARLLRKCAFGFLNQGIVRSRSQERDAFDPAATHEVATHFPSLAAQRLRLGGMTRRAAS